MGIGPDWGRSEEKDGEFKLMGKTAKKRKKVISFKKSYVSRQRKNFYNQVREGSILRDRDFYAASSGRKGQQGKEMGVREAEGTAWR